MSVIEFRELTKDYAVGFVRKRRVRALDRLTLSVQRGEVFGFLGANGAGKTTAIKLLMRLIFPTSGTARVCGRPVDDVAMHRRIGYLPEQPYFYDYLTPRELLEHFGALFGYTRARARRRAAELLERVGLDKPAWTQHLRRLSKGMLQRVGVAQALVNEPEVVVLDEPMSGLDPVGRREIRDLIASLRALGTTVFFSSHILADIEVLCDRVAILEHGRLAHLGRLDDLRRRGDAAGHLEITVSGATADALRDAVAKVESARLTASPTGARIEVAAERDVDAVLAAVRPCGARLVSVQPLRQALEDLFRPPSR
ncbi:MAG TPA: ABC transporter ATP-binding protein [Methylomirabilota bacterium]|nr:ABC transporter ATP-binding protein [Methylomirabilota bacterium]